MLKQYHFHLPGPLHCHHLLGATHFLQFFASTDDRFSLATYCQMQLPTHKIFRCHYHLVSQLFLPQEIEKVFLAHLFADKQNLHDFFLSSTKEIFSSFEDQYKIHRVSKPPICRRLYVL